MNPARTLTFLATFVATLAGFSPAHADFVSGFDDDYQGTVRPYEWGGVHGHSGPLALLSEFSFEYADSDHHLRIINISGTPYWGYDTEPSVSYNFGDENGDDDIYYRLGHYNVIAGFGENNWVDGYCTGSCWIYIGADKPSPRHLFALTDFHFSYDRGEDHHVDEIAIIESGDWLYVAFNDKNDDDEFFYQVHYVWLDEVVVDRLDSRSGTRARDSVSVSRPDFTAIRGFELDFEPDCTSGGDHHVQKVAVLQSSLSLRDRNGDDCFDWWIKWMELDRSFAWE